MKKITDIFLQKEQTLSVEFFSPKTEKGQQKLEGSVAVICRDLHPDYLSVTYGAGGSTREGTGELVTSFQQRFGLPVMHHLTCIGSSRDELRALLAELYSKDVMNILALRGDAPADNESWQPHAQGFHYATELVELIRSLYEDRFAVGVAGFPEDHPESSSSASDIRFLKSKIEAGSDFIITQFFFENSLYFDYVRRVREAGIQCRIIPGILPITDYQGLLRFSAGCGASVPECVHEIFQDIADDPLETLRRGVAFAVDQCNQLLKNRAPGIHFYSVNKHESLSKIIPQLDMK